MYLLLTVEMFEFLEKDLVSCRNKQRGKTINPQGKVGATGCLL